jgi:hypothetical protein
MEYMTMDEELKQFVDLVVYEMLGKFISIAELHDDPAAQEELMLREKL